MRRVPQLVWDDWNKEHIKKHSVTVDEVEEAYKNQLDHALAKSGRTVIYGKTKAGRVITVFVSYEKQRRPYVVSARDMSKAERRQYL